MMRQTWLMTLIIVAAVAGGSYVLYLSLRPAPLPGQVLYGNGHVEGTEVRVSAEVNGRIIKSTLVEGTTVEAGALLVGIDPTEYELQRAKAQAETTAIEKEQRKVEEELATWRHHLEMAQTDYERYHKLHEKGTVSSQQLEKSEDKYRDARGRVNILEAQLQVIAARLEAAKTTHELVETNLAKTKIFAPIKGAILVKAVEPGEYVRVGQVIGVIVDLSQLELKVFIQEKHIGKVKLGDQARVQVDAFPDRFFDGRVARIDQKAQFTPREIHMPEERIRMVFGVTLEVDNTDRALKPGMPADAWILWKVGANWPENLPVPQ